MLRHTLCARCLQPIVLLITESGPVFPCDSERTSWLDGDGNVESGYAVHECWVEDVAVEELQ